MRSSHLDFLFGFRYFPKASNNVIRYIIHTSLIHSLQKKIPISSISISLFIKMQNPWIRCICSGLIFRPGFQMVVPTFRLSLKHVVSTFRYHSPVQLARSSEGPTSAAFSSCRFHSNRSHVISRARCLFSMSSIRIDSKK